MKYDHKTMQVVSEPVYDISTWSTISREDMMRVYDEYEKYAPEGSWGHGLQFQTYEEYGDVRMSTYFVYTRHKTQDELKAEEDRKNQQEIREKQEFLRLKSKFEGK